MLELSLVGKRTAARSTGKVETKAHRRRLRCGRMFEGGVRPERIFGGEFSTAGGTHELPPNLALHGSHKHTTMEADGGAGWKHKFFSQVRGKIVLLLPLLQQL